MPLSKLRNREKMRVMRNVTPNVTPQAQKVVTPVIKPLFDSSVNERLVRSNRVKYWRGK